VTEGAARPASSADQAAAVEVRRSARRRRTVSAYRDGDRTVILIPAGFSKSDEQRWIANMLAKLEERERRASQQSGDRDLALRAEALSAEHLDGRAVPTSVRWVSAMRSRWGSCTPSSGAIRISDALQSMPRWVLDYVLLHELAHLLRAGHDERFWALVARYPRTERARGYLEGVAAAARLGISEVDEEPEPPAVPPSEPEEVPDVDRARPRSSRRRGAVVQEDFDSLLSESGTNGR
jgi:predicted metal-dependent hydrolase